MILLKSPGTWHISMGKIDQSSLKRQFLPQDFMPKYLRQCSACGQIQGLPVQAQWPVKLRGTGACTGLWKSPVFLQHLGGAETFWTMTSGSPKSLVLVLCTWKAL